MIKPLRDKIILKPIHESQSKGIIVAETVEKKTVKAEVVSVGEDVEQVKQGDVIYFIEYGPTKLKVNGEELFVATIDDILAYGQKD